MKILIKFATRGRAIKAKATIDNIFATISHKIDFAIVVSADLDDPEMNNPGMLAYMNHRENILFCLGTSKSKIDAINRDMDNPWIKSYLGTWDMLINMSDDMTFTVQDWDLKMKELVEWVWGEGYTDWFAHFNDSRVGILLPTMSIMGRKYYERDGYIYHPDYKSFSCDAEAMYVAMMRHRYHYFAEALFSHDHPSFIGGANDVTYTVNSQATTHDEKVYWARLNNYFHEPITESTPIPYRKYVNQKS